MRIIGGRDYYDLAMAYGRDDDVMFVRKLREVDRKDFPIAAPTPHFHLVFKKNGRRVPTRRHAPCPVWYYKPNEKETWFIEVISVVFCGRLYRALRISEATMRCVFWHEALFKWWLDLHAVAVTIDYQHRGLPLSYVIGPQPPLEKRATDWVLENGVVTAISLPDQGKEAWRVNSDELRTIEFVRVLDPWSAWQEISMFVGGVLPASSRRMVSIDGTTRLEKHGFDRVTSFRNMPRDG